MDDVRERLCQAGTRIAPPDRPLERLLDRRDRRHRRQRVAAAAVALAIAAGVAGGSLALLSGLARDRVGIGDGEQPPAAAPNLTLRAGQYFYLKIESSLAADGWVRDEETWWAVDGSGQIRNDGTRQDKYPQQPSGVYGPAKFPVETDVSGLSIDPNELATQLGEGDFGRWLAGEPEPDRVWDAVTTLLLDFPNAAPDLRAALFQVAADQDGVRTIAGAQDPAGRSAVAIEFASTSQQTTWTMYFDPSTRQLMAWTSSYDGNPPAWVILDSGIVDAPGVKPDGGQWLFPSS